MPTARPRRTERLTTERLDLVPLRAEDAASMVGVLADPALYAFTGGEPPGLEELQERFARQVTGRSADGSQTWHNWIVRWRATGEPVGFVQATWTVATRVADVAWLTGTSWQGRGLAAEAATAMIDWLWRRGAAAVTAHVHPDHHASAAIAARIGLAPTDIVEDGERLWRRDQPQPRD